MSKQEITRKGIFFRGVLMGVADLIPGVSGGTIALITGIYSTLLKSISNIDKIFLGHLLKLEFEKAACHINLKFLIPLLIGICSAVLSFARIMHYLLEYYPIPLWSLFMGLVGASALVLFRSLEKIKSSETYGAIISGFIFAFTIVGLIPLQTPDESWFIFVCGFISIMAMILPGISGSFLLLMLGKYAYITGALRNPFGEGALIIIGTFGAGAILGLLSFSRGLNWAMINYHNRTMAFLTGVLLGSMRKIWPYKEILEKTLIRGKVKVLREENILPPHFDSIFFLGLVLAAIGFVFVTELERRSQFDQD